MNVHLAAKHWHLSAPNIAMHGDGGFVLIRLLFCSYDQLSSSSNEDVSRLQLNAWCFLVEHEGAAVDKKEKEDWSVRVKEDSLSFSDHDLAKEVLESNFNIEDGFTISSARGVPVPPHVHFDDHLLSH